MQLYLYFLGGSLAYWQWTTNTSERTSVALTVTEEFRCDADGGGDISSNEKYLVPSDCMNSDYAIQRTITVNPTLFSNNTNVSMDLWLNVNNIGTGLKNSENLMYSLTTSSTSCTNQLITYGSFNGMANGSKIELLNDKLYSSTFTDTYYLYIWLDKKETSPSTMNQSFNFSLGGECTGTSKGEPFYAVYSADDTSLRFYKEDEGVIIEGEQYEGRTATNVYKAYEGDSYNDTASLPWFGVSESVEKIVIEDEIKPISTAHWFRNFKKVSSVNVENLDTSNTINMEYMFSQTGNSESVTEFEIIGLNDLNVSNVEDMNVLFQLTGNYATTFDIGDLSSWDVSNVKYMYYTFRKLGYNATTFDIGDLSNWDVSNVIDMGAMFQCAGYSVTEWSVGNFDDWDVSNVINMQSMFAYVGYSTTTFDIGNLSEWDVSNVIDMARMFQSAGRNATSFNIGNIDNWDTSNVKNMAVMFSHAGYSATSFNIGNLNNWDTSNVEDMNGMFYFSGYNATSFNIGNLDNWDTSNVKNMATMFGRTGYNAISFNIGNLDNWDTSKVKNMYAMFIDSGHNATSFNIGDISRWDTSNVINMFGMFTGAGYNATYSLDLSGWNVNSVVNYGGFYNQNKVIPPVWVNENVNIDSGGIEF